MVKLDICAWCRHYNGLLDGWLPACKAFPNGFPSPKIFDPKAGVECNEGVCFEVNEKVKEEYLQVFRGNEKQQDLEDK